MAICFHKTSSVKQLKTAYLALLDSSINKIKLENATTILNTGSADVDRRIITNLQTNNSDDK